MNKTNKLLLKEVKTIKMDIANIAPTTKQIIVGNEPVVNLQAMLGIMKRDSSLASINLSKPISKALEIKALLIITKYKAGQNNLEKSLDKFVNLIATNLIRSGFKFTEQTIQKLTAYFLQIGPDNYITEIVNKLENKKQLLKEELTPDEIKQVKSIIEQMITNMFYKIYTRSNFILKP